MNSNFKKFSILWFGQLVSSIGQGLTAFALGVVAYELSAKAMDTSLVMLLGFLPTVLLSVPAGVLADRHDRRLLMILGDGLSALGPLFILLMMINGKLEITHILIGVLISSIFSALMLPAFQATVSDILDKEEYTKASGLVQLASSAKFLIAPILAGFLLKKYSLETVLIVDISTLILTVATTIYVKSGLQTKTDKRDSEAWEDMKEGWGILRYNKGLFALVMLSTLLTFSMGFIQSLASPYFLSFTTSDVLGSTMTISALGMLVTSIYIGGVGIKKNIFKILVISLILAGVFMIAFGSVNNIYVITISGFLFFTCLPLINTTLDYLVRTNTKKEDQGRVWAFIGLISQLGFIVAYPLTGFLADNFFTPALSEGGILANNIGKLVGTGAGRGIGFEIMLAGLILIISALILAKNKEVKSLETKQLIGETYEFEDRFE